MRKTVLVALLLAGSAASAFAQSALTTTDYSATLGTTVSTCVPADASRKTLIIENPYASGANNVCYCVGASCTPSCSSTAGSSVLAPGAIDSWAPGAAPREAVQCIASGATTPVTIRAGK